MIIGLLIVKNEQAVLQRCIDHWSKVVDRFFILDTGSSSRDYLYLLKSSVPFNYYCTTYDKFHFDVARNDCIDYAMREGASDGDYFVFIDADDVLPEGFKFPELTKDVYAVNYRTSPTTSHIHHRIWRAGLKLRYKGAVHEFLDIKWDKHSVETLPLEVIHLPVVAQNKDPNRNLNILISNRNTMRELFYTGNELKDHGRFDEACIYWEHYINRAKFEATWHEELMCCYWRLARYTKDKDKALSICREGLSKFPNCAELHGEVAYRNGQKYVATIKWFNHLFGEKWFYV
jgi:glycosyltransferase involved in cell wall biosynthesis